MQTWNANISNLKLESPVELNAPDVMSTPPIYGHGDSYQLREFLIEACLNYLGI
jgi:hypothetical protein